MKKENKIEVLENGAVIITGQEAIAAWNKTFLEQDGYLKSDSRLTEEENKEICDLAYFPEDEDVDIKISIENKDKPMAIAIYDCYNGAILNNNTDKAQSMRKIFIKLFKKEPSKLF
jgi:hypothetical protein